MSDSGGNLKLTNDIKDLLIFYVKTNYEQYLKANNIEFIPLSDIENVVEKLYSDRKDHLKIFIKVYYINNF